jgi:hypothetical protein
MSTVLDNGIVISPDDFWDEIEWHIANCDSSMCGNKDAYVRLVKETTRLVKIDYIKSTLYSIDEIGIKKTIKRLQDKKLELELDDAN